MAELFVGWNDESRVIRLTGLLDGMMPRAKQGLRRAGLILQRQIKLNLSGPAHRNFTYYDAGSRKARMAAAGGQDITQIKSSNRRLGGSRYSSTGNTNPYPGVRTGNLRSSVQSVVSSDGMVVLVGPTAVYGRIHEIGGMAGRGRKVFIPPRPYVRPAWNQSREEILSTMHRAIMGAGV